MTKPFFNPRTLAWLLCAASVATLIAACGTQPSGDSASSDSASTSTTVLESLKTSGHLRACYINYPPFVLQDPSTRELSGYFIELLDAIAKEGSFAVDYEETNWGTMVTALQTRKCDVVVSGVFSTIPRGKEVTFTTPVMYVGISAIAKKGDTRFKTVADLAQRGLTIAVTTGEVGEEYAKRFLPDAKLINMTTDDISRPMLEVPAGRADIALGDSMTAFRFAKAHPEVQNVFADNPFYVYATSLMVRRNDPEFLDFLNHAIEQMELSGVTDRLEAKYKEGSTAWISKRKPWQ